MRISDAFGRDGGVVPARCGRHWTTRTTSTRTKSSRKFAAKEAEFREARNNYTYRQTVKMEELDRRPGGKWEEVDDIIFTPEGKRMREGGVRAR